MQKNYLNNNVSQPIKHEQLYKDCKIKMCIFKIVTLLHKSLCVSVSIYKYVLIIKENEMIIQKQLFLVLISLIEIEFKVKKSWQVMARPVQIQRLDLVEHYWLRNRI